MQFTFHMANQCFVFGFVDTHKTDLAVGALAHGTMIVVTLNLIGAFTSKKMHVEHFFSLCMNQV